MGYLVLEMMVVGGEELKDFNLSSPNMNFYVMAILKGASLKEQNAQTSMVEGGENLSWNYPINFYIDRSKQIEALKSQLTFTLKSKNNFDHEDQTVGQTIVPIIELLQIATIDGGSMQNVCYPIEEASKHIDNGKLHFAFKLRSPQVQSQPPPPLEPPPPVQQTEALQLEKQEQEQEQPPRKQENQLTDAATKGMMELSVSVASNYILTLFGYGQPPSTTIDHSLPSSSVDASATSVVGSSFYDETTPTTTFEITSTLALDIATSSFYSGDAPLADLPENDTFSAVVESTACSYSGDPPLDNFPNNDTSGDPPLDDFPNSDASATDPTSLSIELFVPPSDAAEVTTICEEESSSLLEYVAEVLSCLF